VVREEFLRTPAKRRSLGPSDELIDRESGRLDWVVVAAGARTKVPALWLDATAADRGILASFDSHGTPRSPAPTGPGHG